MPAIGVAIRKLLPDLTDSDSLTFRGKLFVEDKAVIYDITAGEPVKRHRKRKTDEEASEAVEEAEVDESPAEEPEPVEEEPVEEKKTVVKKPDRGRPKRQ